MRKICCANSQKFLSLQATIQLECSLVSMQELQEMISHLHRQATEAKLANILLHSQEIKIEQAMVSFQLEQLKQSLVLENNFQNMWFGAPTGNCWW